MLFLLIAAIAAVSAAVFFCLPAKEKLEKTLYLLCADVSERDASAYAEKIYSLGGAGVLFDGKPLYACYYSEEDAEKVSSRLREEGESVFLSVRKTKYLYFRGNAEKKAKESIAAIAKTVYESSVVLYETANGCEEGRMNRINALAAAEDAVGVVLFRFEEAQKLQIRRRDAYQECFSFADTLEERVASLKRDGVTSASLRCLHAEFCCFFLNLFEIFGK